MSLTDHSWTVAALSAVTATLRNAWATSLLGRATGHARRVLAVASGGAWCVRLVSRLLSGSVVVDWLGTEPTPTVVRLDFRETVFAGWFLAALDRVFEHGRVRAGLTGLETVGRRVRRHIETNPVRWCGIVLTGGLSLNIVLTSILGATSSPGLGGKLIALGIALVATRTDRSAPPENVQKPG